MVVLVGENTRNHKKKILAANTEHLQYEIIEFNYCYIIINFYKVFNIRVYTSTNYK